MKLPTHTTISSSNWKPPGHGGNIICYHQITKIVLAVVLILFQVEWNLLSLLSKGSTETDFALQQKSLLKDEIGEIDRIGIGIGSGSSVNENSWCETVQNARSTLNSKLHIKVPCEEMSYAKSAVVVYITSGASRGGSSKNFIDGVMALGASLNDNLTTKDTHKLLLLRQDFISNAPNGLMEKMKKIGWIIGVAPIVDIDEKYVPEFSKYKTVYSKISILGLSEYECVLLLDADTLVVGNINELMTCNILKPNFRAAGGMDLYHGQWSQFNTGSVLWRPESEEMNRVYDLTKDPTFMKKFESDQIFTNAVYPSRENIEVSNRLAAGEMVDPNDLGSIAHLPWAYNAQTHLEFQLPDYWDARSSELKIIHFTWFKGWQCQKRLDEPPPLNPKRAIVSYCYDTTKCGCHEGYRWHQYLKKAKETLQS